MNNHETERAGLSKVILFSALVAAFLLGYGLRYFQAGQSGRYQLTLQKDIGFITDSATGKVKYFYMNEGVVQKGVLFSYED